MGSEGMGPRPGSHGWGGRAGPPVPWLPGSAPLGAVALLTSDKGMAVCPPGQSPVPLPLWLKICLLPSQRRWDRIP